MTSGSDVGDLTYRHALKVADELPTPVVGFANSDIAFDSSLVKTIEVLLEKRGETDDWKKFMIVGRRKNVDVPGELFATQDEEVTPEKWDNIVQYMHSHGSLFQTDAQDYFLFTRGKLWHTHTHAHRHTMALDTLSQS